MVRLFVFALSLLTFAECVNNFLVQGRADTLRVLRNMVLHKTNEIEISDKLRDPFMDWQPTVSRDAAARVFQETVEQENERRGERSQIGLDVVQERATVVDKEMDAETDVVDGDKETERHRRDISHSLIESGRCSHVDLLDCTDFDSEEMTCMFTATGMTCCVCTGALRARKWNLF